MKEISNSVPFVRRGNRQEYISVSLSFSSLLSRLFVCGIGFLLPYFFGNEINHFHFWRDIYVGFISAETFLMMKVIDSQMREVLRDFQNMMFGLRAYM
ncbi:hypothetical protein [Photorhabdus australis]